MKKQIIALAIIFASILPASVMAETLDINAQIAALQAQIAELQAKVQALKASQGASEMQMKSANVSVNKAPCFVLARRLRLGSIGDDVKALQENLRTVPESGWPDDIKPTGYYGKITEESVKRFRAAEGIANSGDRDSTGYGSVGQMTANGLHRRCNMGATAEALTVISPSGGETWTIGTTQLIAWKNDSRYLVSITLVSQGTEYLLATNISNIKQENYPWLVGNLADGNVVPVGTYSIKICNLLTKVCDSSNSTFTIAPQ